MTFAFTATQLSELVAAWLWPLARIGAMVSVAPVFGMRVVPGRVRLGLTLVLTAVIAPVVESRLPGVDPFSAEGALVTAHQVLVGLSMGFALRLIITVLEVAGQLVAQLMGLGFAAMVDPQTGVQVPVVSQFYIVLATLAFLAVDGHLLLIHVLAESFDALQVGGSSLGRDGLWSLVTHARWIFSSAVLVALPAMAALLVVNLAFGVMTRAAPQLNIFAVGFPVALIFGFAIMLLTLPSLVAYLGEIFEAAFAFTRAFVAGAA